MEKKRRIIAVLGLPGSGKSVVINYIMRVYGWPRVYFGDVTFDEVKRRGLEVNEANERLVREGLRAEFGMLVYAERVIEKIHALKGDKPVLVESLYSWQEYLRFKEVFGDMFKTVAVHAAPGLRYDRLSNRRERPLTMEEARSRDYSQIENLHQGGPIAMADYVVLNDGAPGKLVSQSDVIVWKLK